VQAQFAPVVKFAIVMDCAHVTTATSKLPARDNFESIMRSAEKLQSAKKRRVVGSHIGAERDHL
jgi:hypothetical protein